MVKQPLIFLCMALAGCSSGKSSVMNAGFSSDGAIPLKNIHILQNGHYSGLISSDETPEVCSNFMLTETVVHHFFVTAESVDLRKYEHDISASNCYASGTFESAKGDEGDEGDWKIDRTRRGFLHLQDGQTTYFFCNKCNSDLYYEYGCYDADCGN